VELLNDAGNEYTFGTKLHFQMRIRKKDFKDLQSLHTAATAIAETIEEAGFAADLISGMSFFLVFGVQHDYAQFTPPICS
jgi:hypothetical protein